MVGYPRKMFRRTRGYIKVAAKRAAYRLIGDETQKLAETHLESL